MSEDKQAYHEELKQLTESPPGNGFVLLGRTRRAFVTHSETQTLTEGIGNTLTSKMLSFPETRDVLGTTWILTPDLAKIALNLTPRNQYGFYAEWPMTLWRSAENPVYVECEGLEWDTPDRYLREIPVEGYEE